MKHESYLAKRAGDKLVDLAKSAAGALGISYERAFAEVCKTHGDLYRQAQKAGAFHFTEKGAVKGPGFDEPAASPENHADGPGDYEGEDGERSALEEYHSDDDVAGDVEKMRKTADDLEAKACADGRKMSRQVAVTKAYAIHNDAYARLKKKGWRGEL